MRGSCSQLTSEAASAPDPADALVHAAARSARSAQFARSASSLLRSTTGNPSQKRSALTCRQRYASCRRHATRIHLTAYRLGNRLDEIVGIRAELQVRIRTLGVVARRAFCKHNRVDLSRPVQVGIRAGCRPVARTRLDIRGTGVHLRGRRRSAGRQQARGRRKPQLVHSLLRVEQEGDVTMRRRLAIVAIGIQMKAHGPTRRLIKAHRTDNVAPRRRGLG